MPKNIKKALQYLLFAIIIGAFIYVGTRDFNQNIQIDNEKFNSEYALVNQDNIFKYVNAQEVYTQVRNGTAVIFMGFPSNPWSGYYAQILNDAAKDMGIKEILYYDFYEDRANKNGTYQSIVLSLSNYLPVLDENNQDIFAPTLIIVKNGEIVAYDNETALKNGTISPQVYWSDFNRGLKYNTFKAMFQEYLN